MPLVRPDPTLAIESSSHSTPGDPILREVEGHVPNPRDDEDSVDHLVKGEAEEEGSFSSNGADSLVGGIIFDWSNRRTGIPVALVGADEDCPPFTADFVEPKTWQRDIVRAYKKGRVDCRWFEYILLDPHFRASQPPPSYRSVYTRAFTAGMTLSIHPFVKSLYDLHGISPT